MVRGLHPVKAAAAHYLLDGVEFAALDVVLAGIGVDQDVVVSGPFAVIGFYEPLGDDAQQGLRYGPAHAFLLAGRVHAQHPFHRLDGGVGVEGGKQQMAGLGGLDGGGQGFPVANLPDQDHVRILSQGCPQRFGKQLGVLPHLPLANQGATTDVHEFNRILNRENVPALVAVDPIDHGRHGGALARAGGSTHQDHSLGPAAELLQHRRQVEIFEAGDLLGDQPQHHRGPPQRIHQVDAHPHEGKGVGAVVVLIALEAVDGGGAEHLPHPAVEAGRIGARPAGAGHLPPGPEAGFLTHAEVHIGEALLVGDPHDALQVVWLADAFEAGAAGGRR